MTGPLGQPLVGLSVLTPDDWPRFRELRLWALGESPEAFGSRLSDWQGDGDREVRWRARLAIPGSHNLLAALGGRPAGLASGVPAAEAGVVELISLWVAPFARGRGVGDALVQAVARWAQRRGAATLRLAVAPGNRAALALYRRHGFAETAELGDPLPGGGRELVLAAPIGAP